MDLLINSRDQSLIGYFKFLRSSFSNFDLVLVLSMRHLKTRYRRSILGIFWSLLNPLLVTLVLWFIFVQVFAGRFTLPISYALYVLSGTLFANLIQGSLPQIGDSITATGSVAGKARVNPLSLVYAVVISGLVSLSLGLVPLILFSITRNSFGLQAFVLIPWLIIVFFLLVSLGILVGLAYSIFNDLQNVISILLMLISYVTPIFYPVSMLQGVTRKVVEFNPLTNVLEIFRFATVSFGEINLKSIALSLIFVLVTFLLSTFLLYRRWPKMVTKL
jgi:ABC-2 type transport system permease protein